MAKAFVKLVAMAIFAIASSAANAEAIVGRATVIDGDTLEIHGERIRILDIDAPESRQTCTASDGTEMAMRPEGIAGIGRLDRPADRHL
jgi:endonuclease YncB( thermonuclease family)